MFTHVTVGTNDPDRARAFYDAVGSREALLRDVYLEATDAVHDERAQVVGIGDVELDGLRCPVPGREGPDRRDARLGERALDAHDERQGDRHRHSHG